MAVPEVCHVCGRVWPEEDEAGWQGEYDHGVLKWYICPDCTTPEQKAEASVNAAMLEYQDNPFTGTRQARPRFRRD